MESGIQFIFMELMSHFFLENLEKQGAMPRIGPFFTTDLLFCAACAKWNFPGIRPHCAGAS